MENGIYTDINEYIEAVDESTEIQRDLDLQGAPMGRTIGTLIETNEDFDLNLVVTSSRHDLPYPLGADFRVESLHEFADLANKLGAECIEDIDKNDDGSIQIGYHWE
jgi:hypothetical protein